MADETTAVKRKVFLSWEEDVGQSIEFDATLNENHDSNSEPSDFPIESGSDATDHIRRLPEEFSLLGIVSDDPIIVNRSTEAEAASTGGDPNRRAKSAYDWLLQTKDQAKLVRVFTRLRDYRNMAITGISVVRDSENSRVIRANVSLREIRIAVTEQVEAPEPALKAAPARRRKRKQGKKTKKAETDANKAKSRSIASRLAGDQVTSFLGAGPF